MPGFMGRAVQACQDLLGLIYANMKISDVPSFTVGILNSSYHGWPCSRMCSPDQSSLGPEI